MTLVFYQVSEDRDDPDISNMFTLPFSRQNVRLSHINHHFP